MTDKQLRPLGHLDKDAAGKYLGRCSKCGNGRWWDNRGRKRSGQWKKTAPDFTCTQCRSPKWPPSELDTDGSP